jgi:hypothetical protein
MMREELRRNGPGCSARLNALPRERLSPLCLGEILCAVGALQVLPLNGRSVCMSEIVY